MRKKRLMIAIACIILVGIAVIVFFHNRGKNRIRIWTQRRLFPLKCY